MNRIGAAWRKGLSDWKCAVGLVNFLNVRNVSVRSSKAGIVICARVLFAENGSLTALLRSCFLLTLMFLLLWLLFPVGVGKFLTTLSTMTVISQRAM
jgi:hypothetical protein